MLHLSEFVWTLRSSVLVVFNNFLLIDATERRKIRSDQKRFFIALSLYPFHFSRTLPLIKKNYENFPFLFFSVCNVHIYLAVCSKIFYVNNNIESTKFLSFA